MGLTPESLKKKREDLGLSQMKLANAANMGRYNISLFESGNRDLTKEEEAKINEVLKKETHKNGNSNKKK
ncbi:hypothetical protein phi1422_0011 [Bdellovibrio phage phi1422]|uniref:hypothetical protein n=1 Tax=Bdellovibrio phage phi1422 TaxID=1127515 RepID=UPI0002536D0A|nr:hypothetical protein F395_gp11 [Bdellovibrio phage phi1422]AFC22531.1 hypothetical protein phi1422_0011 [Bdellovibrio phage phi1422]